MPSLHRSVRAMLIRGCALISIALLAAAPLGAQQKYAPLPPMYDGSMMPYDFAACTQPPVLPDSLTTVYACYVARHGSRYLSGPAKMKPVMDALIDARNSGRLSDTGEDFLKLMEEVRDANEGNWGDLSPLGLQEEKKLGSRMYEVAYPLLAKDGAEVDAVATFVPRAVMTMYQFTNQLIRINDKVTVQTDEGREYSKLLYCFAADSAYSRYRKEGDWKPVYEEFLHKNVSAAPARRLFSQTDLSNRQLRELTMEMYEVLKGNRAASLPAPTTQWMSVDEYRQCWRTSNLQHYLRNSITPLSDLAGKATLPLLERIISDTDTAIAAEEEGKPHIALNGYFGHAETILPLLSLIKIPNCNQLNLDFVNFDNCWKIQELTPLAANLLLLVAEGPSGRKYAVMQLNGRTIMSIPGSPDIVPWDELRSHWQSIIENI